MSAEPHGAAGKAVQPIETCTATARSGSRCQKRPEPGQRVCRMHGGASPAAREKAAERLLEARIRGELQQAEIRPVTNPIGELATLGGEVLVWLDLCRRNLEHLHSWEYTDAKGVEDVRAYIAVYERALDRAVVTMERMARLGLDAETLRRQLQIEAERPSREQAAGLQRILSAVLAGLDLTADQQQAVPGLLQAAMDREGLL